ncbi:MAG: hypothetical protein MHM6MM_004871 [Cercozoa sp. M6MM]
MSSYRGKRRGSFRQQRDGRSAKRQHSSLPESCVDQELVQQLRSALQEEEWKSELGAVDEARCGITEFTTDPSLSMEGLIKERYTDFLVREITPEGEVVRLSAQKKQENKGEEKKVDDEAIEALKSYAAGIPGCHIAAENDKEDEVHPTSLTEFLEKSIAAFDLEKPDRRTRSFALLLPEDYSKDDRKQLHQHIKALGKHFDSATAEHEGKKCIKVVFNACRMLQKQRISRDKSEAFLHFTLHKVNCDSMSAIKKIAQRCRMKPTMFGISGTKDKRGVTTQRVSVKANQCNEKKLLGAARSLDGIHVGDFLYAPARIDLGNHSGNEFTVALREARSTCDKPLDEVAQQVAQQVSQTGILNYFGMQRFGTTSVGTQAIGRAILRRQFVRAVALILLPRENEQQRIQLARAHLDESADLALALREMPRFLTAETAVLRSLIQNKEGDIEGRCKSALLCVPKRLLSMYVHAWQSELFNRALSLRVSTFGADSVVKGDLVQVDSQVTLVQDPSQHTIDQVVLPLLGQACFPADAEPLLPQNAIGDFFKQELQLEKILPADAFFSKVYELAVPGGFRSIVARPLQGTVTSQTLSYASREQQLVETGIQDDISGETGDSQAVVLRFSLPPSSYATMLLREFTKCDTNKAALMKQSEDASTASTSADASVE